MEIKFKAEYKKVVYEVVAIFINKKVILRQENDLTFEVGWHECRLLQFSGSQDVDGADVYEGYLLKGKTYKEPHALRTAIEIIGVCEREYDNGFGVNADLPKGFRTYPNISECRIIGNIYENPELLEQGRVVTQES